MRRRLVSASLAPCLMALTACADPNEGPLDTGVGSGLDEGSTTLNMSIGQTEDASDTEDPGDTEATSDDGDPSTSTTSGDGDGDGDPSTSTTSGDGDGDPSTSTTSGDGDGDGDPSTSTTSGDGDGDGDVCMSDQDITCGYAGNGETGLMSTWGDMGLYPACTNAYADNADEDVYGFTVSSVSTVTVTMIPTNDDDLNLWLLEGACDPDACTDYSHNSSGQESLSFTAYPGVSYYVVVDGWSFHTGPYNLQVSCN